MCVHVSVCHKSRMAAASTSLKLAVILLTFADQSCPMDTPGTSWDVRSFSAPRLVEFGEKEILEQGRRVPWLPLHGTTLHHFCHKLPVFVISLGFIVLCAVNNLGPVKRESACPLITACLRQSTCLQPKEPSFSWNFIHA